MVGWVGGVSPVVVRSVDTAGVGTVRVALFRQPVMDTAGTHRQFYNMKIRQGFRAVPYTDEGLEEFLYAAPSRDWTDRNIVFPIDTATGTCHLPIGLTTLRVDYKGGNDPPQTNSGDWIFALVLPFMDAGPHWFGWPKRHPGVEVKIWITHQLEIEPPE